MAEDERSERKALGQRSLDDEFAALADSDKVDEELEAMKRALKKEG